MTRKRPGRLATILSAAVLASIIGTGAASAAVPTLIPTWSVIPTKVSDGEHVAFRGSIFNDDTSTVSQLYLVELSRDPRLTLISISSNQGRCNTAGATFICTLGQLKPGKTATVVAVYQTASIGEEEADYSASASWEFNTTGLGSGGGDNSHGDSWPSDPALTVNVTSSGDFGGRYVLNNSLLVVENNQALSNANPHSTRAFSPATGIGVTVEDVDCSVAEPDEICAGFTTGFGQVSKVNVNDGLDVSGTSGQTLLHFYLQLDSSEIPQGTNANTVSVLHTYLGGSETISTRCTFAKKATVPSNAACITVKNLPGGDLGVDVWTFHNGGLRLQ